MDNKIVNIVKEEPFIGEDGFDYIKVTKEILTPRKTYLKGTITGKYRGNKINDESDKSNFFDFEIYEAEVTCNSIDDFSKNKPFAFPNDFKNITNANKIKGSIFPKEKLPQTLPVIISANNKSFGVSVLEPQLFEFDIIRKLHQTDGDDVFGTFNAYISGYVLDYEKEEVEEIIGPILVPPPPPTRKPCESNGIKTGKFNEKECYKRYEYFCKHHPDTVWGSWEKIPCNDGCGYGCLSNIVSIIGFVLFFGFLIMAMPWLGYIICFGIFLFIIGIIAPYLKWIFRILGFIFLLLFISSLFRTCSNTNYPYNPSPRVVDSREVNPIIPIVDTTASLMDTIVKPERDSIITRFRSWNDYDGNNYEGKYQIKLSDYRNATYHKNSLNINLNTINSYDGIVYNLKEFDKNNINSVFYLFDSIGKANKLSRIRFAEMIVTFVQDIPYSIVLNDGCDPSIYNDRFTRNYLINHSGECDGNQRFGINTPVEFLTNLKGDCDTRTLLLYTIFSHYNYDVVLLSSEYYGHSIIGINLPINGVAYNYNNQRYVLWEPTAPNCKPGVISNEISNLNNWRISLKSK